MKNKNLGHIFFITGARTGRRKKELQIYDELMLRKVEFALQRQ
jgi:hypothetical protein